MMMMTIVMIIIFHMESRAKVVTKFGVNVFAWYSLLLAL